MGLSMREISIISILFSIVIIFGAFQVSAENTDSAIPVSQIGAIFDNYFGSSVNVNGTGQIGNFVWTNPKGPTARENIRYGPYIAGNYWSNPDGKGWSDMQEPSVTGYSQVPYEVMPGQGVYDTAPLVRMGHNVPSFADEWPVIPPIDDITYSRYSDPFNITQAKLGAIYNNLRVDGFLNASGSHH